MDRQFKGIWIPAKIWLDDRLNSLDKIILCEIDSLCNEEKGCYASNEYLAEFCQCTTTKISTAISKLIKLGYLEVIKFDGRTRYLMSKIDVKEDVQTLKNLKADFKKSERQTLKNLKADIKNFKGSIYNNIDNNIKDNNIIKKDKYFDNDEINNLFVEFLEIRKKIKAVNSDRAIKTLINKLNKYDDDTKYKMIENSIVNSWKDVYPLKEEKRGKSKIQILEEKFLSEE